MSEITTPGGRKLVADRPYRGGRPMSWLRTEIDRLFDDMLRPGPSLFDFGPRFDVDPAIALVDEDKQYRATAELPGLTEQDVTVTIHDGVLTIAGEKHDDRQEKKDGRLLDERRYGSFARQIALPADVDVDDVKASFKNGVLTVTMAKDAKAPPQIRKIAIEG
jgi:HSP20 family protein